MAKKNCWEVMKCGREVNGANIISLGVCPVALLNDFEGVNGGQNGGRFCWGVAGTLCDGSVSGSSVQKLANCINCRFLKQVNTEQGRDFVLTPKKIIRKNNQAVT